LAAWPASETIDADFHLPMPSSPLLSVMISAQELRIGYG
jgi:hypothetical protein